MANTENFPNTGKKNTGKKKTRHRRYDRCYTELLHLLTKHRFRFTVEPLKEPMTIDGEWDRDRQQYKQVSLDTRVTIDDGSLHKQIAVYIAPNIDALIDPGADTGEYMDAQEVTVWAYNELRDKEVEYGTL